MEYLSWPSIIFYCLFGNFVYYQQLHVRDFKGASQTFLLVLNISTFTGMLSGFAFLIYYGWTVVWWAPIVIFILGIFATIAGVLLEKVVGAFSLSMAGFIGWPVCAAFMFYYVPN